MVALAGLALAETMGKLCSEEPLQVRVGIATGIVVVGAGQAQERGIVGETPNLAARLQGIAEPNMVVIGKSTRKVLGNLFEFHDLGPMDLKGIAGPFRSVSQFRIGVSRTMYQTGRRVLSLNNFDLPTCVAAA